MNDSSSNIKFTPSKDGYQRSVGANKPAGAPTSAKDFKKILKKTESSEDEQQGQIALNEEGLEEQAVQRPVARSLFDLPGGKQPKEVAAEAPLPSPNAALGLAGKNQPSVKAASPFAVASRDPIKPPDSKIQITAKLPVGNEAEVAMAEDTNFYASVADAAETEVVVPGKDVPVQNKTVVPGEVPAAPKEASKAVQVPVDKPKGVVPTNDDAAKSFNILSTEETPRAPAPPTLMEAKRSSDDQPAKDFSQGSFEKNNQSSGAFTKVTAEQPQELSGQVAIRDRSAKGETAVILPQAKATTEASGTTTTAATAATAPQPAATVTTTAATAATQATIATTAAPETKTAPPTTTPITSKVEVNESSKAELASVSTPRRSYLHTEFHREQPDLSYVNPLSIAAPASSNAIAAETTVQRPTAINPDLQILIERMATEITILQQSGHTETTVELKQPPLFDGARLTITTFENVKNEFNIRFENLTQAAQQVLGQQVYRQDLLTNLEQKGYNVHIFTATTFDDSRPIAANVDTPNKGRDEQARERGDQGGQEKREKQR